MPVAASRCHLIQMLQSALTCTNGCSCWSPDEGNSPGFFPYHGCALPTELGGQVTILQLGADIVAATLMKRPIIEHSSAYSADDATGSLLQQPSNALLTSYPAPSTAHAPGTSHRRSRVLNAPPRRASGQGTQWHQAAHVGPEREPHCSPQCRTLAAAA